MAQAPADEQWARDCTDEQLQALETQYAQWYAGARCSVCQRGTAALQQRQRSLQECQKCPQDPQRLFCSSRACAAVVEERHEEETVEHKKHDLDTREVPPTMNLTRRDHRKMAAHRADVQRLLQIVQVKRQRSVREIYVAVHAAMITGAGGLVAVSELSDVAVTLGAGPLAQSIAVGVSVLYVGYNVCKDALGLYRGDITWRQFARRVAVTVTRHVYMCVSAKAGFTAGAAAGSFFLGPIGALIGGVVGAACAGYAASKASDFLFEKEENEELVTKKRLLQEAMTYFHFTDTDIHDAQTFNAQALRDKYRQLALLDHPDRPHGTVEKFQTLQAYRGILEGLLEERDGVNPHRLATLHEENISVAALVASLNPLN